VLFVCADENCKLLLLSVARSFSAPYPATTTIADHVLVFRKKAAQLARTALTMAQHSQGEVNVQRLLRATVRLWHALSPAIHCADAQKLLCTIPMHFVGVFTVLFNFIGFFNFPVLLFHCFL